MSRSEKIKSNTKASKTIASTPTRTQKTMSHGVSKRVSPEFSEDQTCLDDTAMITDALKFQKALCGAYSKALMESSCPNMRKLVSQKMSECACDQFDAFNYMHERNLYPTEDAPSQKVTEAKSKFKEKWQDMSQ
ncbi:MAG: spore coat protein [Firmicutes bacterium]|nr:spore coat protein [Bacillota bacterium]